MIKKLPQSRPLAVVLLLCLLLLLLSPQWLDVYRDWEQIGRAHV